MIRCAAYAAPLSVELVLKVRGVTLLHYTYILRCSDGTLYCGYSTNPEKRAKVHNSGKGAKYTRSRLPVSVVYTEAFETKQEALSRECAIKKLTRSQKIQLIAGDNYNEN